MSLNPRPKCCVSKTSASAQYTFDTLVTFSIQKYTGENGITIQTKEAVEKLASIKTVSTRSFSSSNSFNTIDMQNQFGTNYIFTTRYFANFYMYQYIHYQGLVYKIENSENKNLKNEFCVFITQLQGEAINPNNFI